MADLEAKAFRRAGKALVPADINSEEWLDSIPQGKEVLISARRPRHIANHKHLFAILKVACENLEGYPDTETLLDALKLATHLTRPVMMPDGKIVWIPKSINWAAMPEDEFQRWKARALFVLGQLLGVDPQQLLEETGIRNGRAPRSDFDDPPAGTDDRPEPPASAYEDAS